MAVKKPLAHYAGTLEELRTEDSFTVAWSWLTSVPTTLAGYGITDAQPLDSDLSAIAALSSTGLVARTGSGSAATRSVMGTANQIAVADGDGVGGNPTISLPSAVNFPGTVTLNADPTLALHATTKQYVDGLAANLGKRARVRAATTANITISTALNNGDALDGVTLATGDLVLVKNQSSAQENGVYTVGVSPARAAEFDTYNEHPGSLLAVAEGTTNADTLWLCTSNDGGTLGTTAIAFSKMQVAGELLAANNLSDVASAATARGNIAAAAQTQVDFICGIIRGAIANGDIRLALNLPVGFTINEVTTRSGAGTGTATWKIDTTALGGTANSVSTTENAQTHSTANVAATGNDLVVTISSASGLSDMSFTIKITRTLS